MFLRFSPLKSLNPDPTFSVYSIFKHLKIFAGMIPPKIYRHLGIPVAILKYPQIFRGIRQCQISINKIFTNYMSYTKSMLPGPAGHQWSLTYLIGYRPIACRHVKRHLLMRVLKAKQPFLFFFAAPLFPGFLSLSLEQITSWSFFRESTAIDLGAAFTFSHPRPWSYLHPGARFVHLYSLWFTLRN